MSNSESSDSMPTLTGPALSGPAKPESQVKPFSKKPVTPERPGQSSRSPASGDVPSSTNDATIGPSTNASLSPAKSVRAIDSELPEGTSRYERINEVGRGGCGVIERVVDRALEREVAIKRLVADQPISEYARKQFLHEARITSQLQHPGIVPVHELGITNEHDVQGEAYYVMKLLEGDTLHKQIQSRHKELRVRFPYKPISRHQLVEAITPLLERFIDVCEAIAFAHEQQIIHRDLKPANIMVGEFGETIVLDWGLATKVKTNAKTHSSQRWISGTPAYMSPEQAHGDTQRLDQRSDIFSLGIILHEIVAGENPYAGLETQEVLSQVKEKVPAPLRSFNRSAPPALESIARTAMQMDRERRYRSASELANDIRRFIAGAAVSVHQDSIVDRIMRWARRNRTLATTLAVTTVALLIASSLFGVVIHRAHKAEFAARVEAETAHQSALQSLIEARDAADEWLVGLSGSLEFYPGMNAVRQDLLGKAIDQYERLIQQPLQFGNQAEDDSATKHQLRAVAMEQLERAKCHLRLGDLYRITDNRVLAKRNYDQAGKTLLRLDQTSPEVQIEQVNSWIGRLMMDPSLQSKRDTADRLRTQLRDLIPQDREGDISPQTVKAISAAIRLEIAISRADSSTPASNRDPKHLVLAASTARWLAITNSEAHHHKLSQTTQTELATLLESKGDLNEAIEVWETLIHDLEEHAATQDDHPEQLQSLAHAKLRLASLLVDQSRPQEAIPLYEESIADLEKAWKLLDSDSFFRMNLATAENNLGSLLANGTDAQRHQAEQLLQRSISAYERLIRDTPSSDVVRRLSQSHRAMANVILAGITRPPLDRSSIETASEHLESAAIGYEILGDHQALTEEDRVDRDDVLEKQSMCDRLFEELAEQTSNERSSIE